MSKLNWDSAFNWLRELSGATSAGALIFALISYFVGKPVFMTAHVWWLSASFYGWCYLILTFVKKLNSKRESR